MGRESIGGYFELELQKISSLDIIDNKSIKLNSGRNCLKEILLFRRYQKVYVPYFTCDVLTETIEGLELDYEFYDVNDQLEPIFDWGKIQRAECFLLTNYFGLMDEYIADMVGKVENLIIDNAQALFSPPHLVADTFYSPRKFCGLPDGGILVSDSIEVRDLDIDTSYLRMSHLLKRIDLSPELGHADFKENDGALDGQSTKLMSRLTTRMLNSIDYNSIKAIRRANYLFLEQRLRERNLLDLSLQDVGVPLVYPFRTKDMGLKNRLLDNKVYCATYWPNVLKWCTSNENSFNLTNEIIAIPIDQRYREKEMEIILDIIIN